jgi:hypothetical protein
MILLVNGEALQLNGLKQAVYAMAKKGQYSKTPHIRTYISQVSLNRFLCKWYFLGN